MAWSAGFGVISHGCNWFVGVVIWTDKHLLFQMFKGLISLWLRGDGIMQVISFILPHPQSPSLSLPTHHWAWPNCSRSLWLAASMFVDITIGPKIWQLESCAGLSHIPSRRMGVTDPSLLIRRPSTFWGTNCIAVKYRTFSFNLCSLV